MPLNINGTVYLRSSEVLQALDVSRQTLWRWRQNLAFPAGAKLRGKLVFTEEEFEAIKAIAYRLDSPIDDSDPSQLQLFVTAGKRG